MPVLTLLWLLYSSAGGFFIAPAAGLGPLQKRRWWGSQESIWGDEK